MKPIFNIIFKVLAFAMGIAVVVISILKIQIGIENVFMLLGLGLAGLALSMFDQKEKNQEDDTAV